jgi:hypothetical protein
MRVPSTVTFSQPTVDTGIRHFLPDTSGNKEYTTVKM